MLFRTFRLSVPEFPVPCFLFYIPATCHGKCDTRDVNLQEKPDFSNYSPLSLKVEYRADYDYSKIDALHNAVNELLRNSHPKWFADGMVDCADPVRDRVEHLAVDGKPAGLCL